MVAVTKPLPKTGRAGILGWLLFDCSTQPFFTLITTFVFAPYFASAVASSPVEGQALWGYATAAAGLTIALTAPMMGAVADAAGRRKPFVALFGLTMAAAAAGLWFVTPETSGAVALALVLFAIGTIGAEYAGVFNNAMIPSLVPPDRIGRLSGTGWAVGYAGGLVSLAFTLVFLAADPGTGRTLAGLEPLFGLDPAMREGDRAVGPLTALWFAVFITPLLLFTPDTPGRMRITDALRQGPASVIRTLRTLPSMPNAAWFLAANMIYTDGLIALFAFGGVYAAGVLGWGTIEIGVFGILLTITGTIGAFLGGRLDDRFGSKAVILGAIGILTVGALGILSLDRTHVFFVVPVTGPTPGDGLYASAPEMLLLALGGLIGLAAGPVQAASRTMLVRIAPPERIGEFFGLFALTGKITSFVGPFLVGLTTQLSGSQRFGVLPLLLLFILGGALLWQVRPTPPIRAR